mmetsp:Transcript_28834/g.80626  ORF Transcript_28834/g.80626 Transcript_28834/m.80626 type:complete len:214 (+) Transcript_28834:332-973(+)
MTQQRGREETEMNYEHILLLDEAHKEEGWDCFGRSGLERKRRNRKGPRQRKKVLSSIKSKENAVPISDAWKRPSIRSMKATYSYLTQGGLILFYTNMLEKRRIPWKKERDWSFARLSRTRSTTVSRKFLFWEMVRQDKAARRSGRVVLPPRCMRRMRRSARKLRRASGNFWVGGSAPCRQRRAATMLSMKRNLQRTAICCAYNSGRTTFRKWI